MPFFNSKANRNNNSNKNNEKFPSSNTTDDDLRASPPSNNHDTHYSSRSNPEPHEEKRALFLEARERRWREWNRRRRAKMLEQVTRSSSRNHPATLTEGENTAFSLDDIGNSESRTETADFVTEEERVRNGRSGGREEIEFDDDYDDLDEDDEDEDTRIERDLEDSKEHSDVENLTRRNHLGRFRTNPVGFMIRLTAESTAFFQGAGWRSYSDYIGARILYQGFTADMHKTILRSPRVTQVIKNISAKQAAEALTVTALPESQAESSSTASDDPKSIAKAKSVSDLLQTHRQNLLQRKQASFEQELRELAKSHVEKLVAQMESTRIVRFAAFIINNLLTRLYHQGIHIKESEFLELRKHAIQATAQGIPLIILPCHKSHIDYLVISYVFFRLGLALPHIAAGDNLDLPLVGRLLKGAGAFFIRRTFGDDPLYQAIVKEYVETLLERGHTLEWFIEGTRSRTGKLLTPKFGILKIVLDAHLSGRVKDAIIVPMSIGYDKVIETESYVNELLGANKEKESLRGLMSNTRLLQLKWGRIDVRFAKPYSLKEYIAEQSERRHRPTGPFNPSDPQDKVVLLQALGYRVLSDINSVSVIMPTALVGTVILTLRGRGVGRSELIRRVKWLRRGVLDKGGRVADFGGMRTGTIVDRAVGVLRELIGERRDLLERVFYATKRFELSYYRNQVIHLFIQEAIVSAAMYVTIKRGGSKQAQRVPYAQLLLDVVFLSRLLKVDFIYPPGSIEDNLNRTLKYMEETGVITLQDEFVALSDRERAIGRENYDFYCFLIWPFVETYWLAAVSLFSLAPAKAKRRVAVRTPTVTDNVENPSTSCVQPLPQESSPPRSVASDAPSSSTAADPTSISPQLSPPASANAPTESQPTPALPTTPLTPSLPSKPISTSTSEEFSENPWVDERIFMSKVQLLGKSLYYQGDLSYYEAINKETLKNAFLHLQESGMLRVRRPPASQRLPSTVSLHPRYVPPRTGDGVVRTGRTRSEAEPGETAGFPNGGGSETTEELFGATGELWAFVERVGNFRREGKNRRDNATVSTRVLRLASMIAQWTPQDIKEKTKGKAKAKPAAKL